MRFEECADGPLPSHIEMATNNTEQRIRLAEQLAQEDSPVLRAEFYRLIAQDIDSGIEHLPGPNEPLEERVLALERLYFDISRLPESNQTAAIHKLSAHSGIGVQEISARVREARRESLPSLEAEPSPSLGSEPWHISGTELWGREFAEPRWLVESLWPEQACGFISGPSGARKTWLALELSISVVTGKNALARFSAPHPGPVLYLAGEDKLRHIQARMQLLAGNRGISSSELEHLHFAEAQGMLGSDSLRQRLTAFCRDYHPRLIVLDPLVRMHSADENSAKEFQPILSFLRQLQREQSVSVLLTHHVRKSRGEERGGGRKMEALRGTGDLGAWADTVLIMDRHGESAEAPSQVTVAKQRDVPESEPFLLTLEVDRNAARLTYHEGDARALRVHKVMEDALNLLRKHGVSGKGMLKTELESKLKGGNDVKRDALERLLAQKRIDLKLLTRPAKDGKARKQTVVFLVDTTSAGKGRQGLAKVPDSQLPTPAAPQRGAGVEELGGGTPPPPGEPLTDFPSRPAVEQEGGPPSLDDFAETIGEDSNESRAGV